ncbi:hypothetical protein TEA_021135 [Camellia sinensis var. sinensis]|uniref:Transmembrane protein 135 N-terminal domain-containing protein n=1 Tax=Camellia sinensis var. sinensis TaxID=542762 RepID=A0A4S4EEK4_CAMSN|nr:hypothetical protein TEA_021135 [Camellia sinensis var. sinensis]
MSIDSDLRRNMAETAVLRRERRERGGATAYGGAANLRWRMVEEVLRRRTAVLETGSGLDRYGFEKKDLIVREEACRIGLLFGGFTGSYHALSVLITPQSPRTSFTSGEAIGDMEMHCFLPLHAHSSFQVMYSFVMRPESLPKSYQDFIQKTGPVARPVYKAVRDCCRGGPVDVTSLSAYLSSRKNSNFAKLEEFPSIIPCSIIHPHTNSCLVHNANAASATFRKTFPLYFSLTFVPFVVLHLQKVRLIEMDSIRQEKVQRFEEFVDHRLKPDLVRAIAERKVASKDHKLVYWVAGGLAALSVLLEKKGRRGELALYVLPRAGDSLWYILVNRHLLPNIKNAEVALFCACMGGIMYYLEHEPDTMAPFLRSLIRRFLASRISNPAPSSNRSASYTYLQTLDAIKKPKLRENRDGETSASEKYNLESIPGL